MITRQQRLLGFAAAGVIIGFLLLQYSLQSPPSLAKRAAEAEGHFQEQEHEAEQWLERLDLWEAILQDGFSCEEARLIQNAPLPLFLLQDKELIFWNTTNLSLSADQLVSTASIVQTVNDKYYYLLRQSWKGGVILVAALAIPENKTDNGTHAVKNRAGNLVYFADGLSKSSSSYQWISPLIGCLSILLFIFIINMLLRQIRYRILAVGLMILAIILLMIGMCYWAYSSVTEVKENVFTLWADTEIPLSFTIVGSVLSIWVVSRWQYIWTKKPTLVIANVSLASSLAYWSINVLIIGIGAVIKYLVLHDTLDYDFDNVLQLPWLELICILAVLILLVTHLLYSLWVIRKVQRLPISKQNRLISIGVSVLLALPISSVLHLDLGLFALCLILLLFTSLLDLFVELDMASPAWLILWLSLLSAFATGLLLKYQIEVNNGQRVAFARQIASYEDRLAEQALDTLMDKLADSTLNDWVLQVQQDAYLEKNYSFALQELDTSIQLGQSAQWIKQRPNNQYISYTIDYDGKRLALQPKWKSDRRILSSLIPASPLLQSDYSYAIRYDSTVIIRKGYLEEEWLKGANWENDQSTQFYTSNQRALLYHQSDQEGYQVLVSERLGGYLKPASLFSYFFVLLTLILLVIFLLDRPFKLFPSTPIRLFVGTPSLRHRIQLSTIGLSLAALVLAGWVTVIFIRRDNLHTQSEQLLEKVDVMLRNVEGAYSKLDSSSFLATLSNVHQVDLFSYTSDGTLQATSFPYLFEQGLKAPYIVPAAFYAYQRQGIKPAILSDEVGGLRYLAASIPLPENIDRSSRFLIVAFASGEQGLKENTIAFIGNLLNLYVFLLLIASVSAIAVAKTITRPLLEIGEKLRRLKLGENEPLSWGSEDEIGQLVSAYNAMIAELEISTEKLKQSEREGAWREMAKQVAHEIKNPLTPMKLSIQYLQHAQQSDPERARSLISRVSKTLIEQIDGLAHIATAFSNFAKMPRAELALVDMNAILRSVHQLFTEGGQQEEEINLVLPDHTITVHADGKQLLRIFNNLVKNAQQAIPEERQGQIQMHLYESNGNAIVAIRDNGTGIPEEVQPKVFQPNFTTKSSGMGLGLAMCKSMIEAMEGDIYFETEEDLGTTFFIRVAVHTNKV
jgi:signal transduction histidine kinase